jgi:Cu+-exporting ATPase
MEKTYSAIVKGMTCGNCALTISQLLAKKGMSDVSANAASGEVHFTAGENADINAAFDAIDGMGYHVVREEENTNGASHTHDHSYAGSQDMLLPVCVLLTIPLLLHMFISWAPLHNPWVQLALATPVYAIGCYVFMGSAFRSLKHGLPNMNVLIMLGASAAYIYSLVGLLFFSATAHQYIFFETAAAIITLVMAGNWLEHRTVKATTAAVDSLVKLQPQTAKLVMTDSIGKETIQEVDSKYVRFDDVVMVNNGDTVPVDGQIIFGKASIDEHMISGESAPAFKTIGNDVVGGTLLLDGHIKIKATGVGASSVLSGIIRMVREAQGNKAPLQKLADKISAVFVPVVLGISVLTLLVNYFLLHHPFSESLMRGIAVLVISCPCAMGLATPAAVAVGLGRAARNGILIKGGDTLENLKRVRQIVFDKTGTLTTGKLKIGEFHLKDIAEAEFKNIIASLEKSSSHPVAKSIAAQWKGDKRFKEIAEIKGRGIEAVDEDGHRWQLGSYSWLQPADDNHDLYLFKDGSYTGALKLSDELRADAVATIAELRQSGYRTILLSGDRKRKCEELAALLGIDEVFAERSPEQKNHILEELMAEAPTAMVGDGINDAPALARATVGISLSESTSIAIQSANVILSNNKLSTLPKAIKLGIYTEQTIRQNLFWAFLYNVIAIPVAAAGLLSPTWGAGVMALSDVVLVINSLRLGVRRID